MGEITDEQFEDFEERWQYEEEVVSEEKLYTLINDNYGALEEVVENNNPLGKSCKW